MFISGIRIEIRTQSTENHTSEAVRLDCSSLLTLTVRYRDLDYTRLLIPVFFPGAPAVKALPNSRKDALQSSVH